MALIKHALKSMTCKTQPANEQNSRGFFQWTCYKSTHLRIKVMVFHLWKSGVKPTKLYTQLDVTLLNRKLNGLHWIYTETTKERMNQDGTGQGHETVRQSFSLNFFL